MVLDALLVLAFGMVPVLAEDPHPEGILISE